MVTSRRTLRPQAVSGSIWVLFLGLLAGFGLIFAASVPLQALGLLP